MENIPLNRVKHFNVTFEEQAITTASLADISKLSETMHKAAEANRGRRQQ
jgi:hypothetical protein